MDTGREVSILADKSNADLTRTKGHKRRKNKVSFRMRMVDSLTINIFLKKGMDLHIKFHAGKKRSTVKISVEITQL
jgi:O-succinylbenzoate synthase